LRITAYAGERLTGPRREAVEQRREARACERSAVQSGFDEDRGVPNRQAACGMGESEADVRYGVRTRPVPEPGSMEDERLRLPVRSSLGRCGQGDELPARWVDPAPDRQHGR